jgi:hypothetical protein
MTHTIAWRTPVFSLIAAALALAAPGRAAAQPPAGCSAEITSLPYTINSNGVYCLKNTMFTSLASGAAITVGSSITAVIDLRGFAINNLVAGSSSTAIGVLAAGKSNITVRNGRIQSFKSGITLDSVPPADTYGNVVENVQIDSVTSAGIVIHGRAHQVRNCTVTRYGLEGGTGSPTGIMANGDGILIEGNVVAESYSTGGRGIRVLGANNQVVGNRVLNPQSYGLFLAGATYRDNLVTGAVIPYQGGLDAGNNQ